MTTEAKNRIKNEISYLRKRNKLVSSNQKRLDAIKINKLLKSQNNEQ